MNQVLARNPPLPFISQLSQPLQIGDAITIDGAINFDASRLIINLKCGASTNSNIAVHFNPRFDTNSIVINTFKNSSWGNEELHPLCFSKTISLYMAVEQSCFQFTINGGQRFAYKHRLPLSSITFIEIVKGLTVHEVSLKRSTVQFRTNISSVPGVRVHVSSNPTYPSQPANFGTPRISTMQQHPSPGGYQNPYTNPPRAQDVPYNPTYPPQPANFGRMQNPLPHATVSHQTMYTNPSIPFVCQIPGGVVDGKMIYISGRPKQQPYRFEINLNRRKTPSSANDIAFHFNPRFEPDNCVVRNSLINGNWGAEERHGSFFPFMPGSSFDLIIKIEPTGYMVAINGVHFTHYNHRVMPFKLADILNIDGDVKIFSVRFG